MDDVTGCSTGHVSYHTDDTSQALTPHDITSTRWRLLILRYFSIFTHERKKRRVVHFYFQSLVGIDELAAESHTQESVGLRQCWFVSEHEII